MSAPAPDKRREEGLAPDATVVVVGASLAGLRAAETLRAEGHRGPLVMIGAEADFNYDRPPLSKQFLAGTWAMERIRLRPDTKIEALGLDLRLGHRAVQLDLGGNRLELDDGSPVGYDGLVIATGACARTLPGMELDAEGNAAVHTLRTLADARALAGALEGAQRVAVVGGGFIGAEVASTCAARGLQVTVVEALPTPLAGALGEAMGSVCAGLHGDHGVTLKTATTVRAVVPPDPGRGRPARLELVPNATSGSVEVLGCDVVVAGIGVAPCDDWLVGSGLHLDDGVVTDAALFAAPSVVVAGDVARFPAAFLDGHHVRLEHWTNAAEQGAHAARSLLAGRGAATSFETVPYFWSDQYGVKIQMLGHPQCDDDVAVVEGSGSIAERRFVALYERHGRLAAALGFGRPRQLMGYRALLEAGASFDEALASRQP